MFFEFGQRKWHKKRSVPARQKPFFAGTLFLSIKLFLRFRDGGKRSGGDCLTVALILFIRNDEVDFEFRELGLEDFVRLVDDNRGDSASAFVRGNGKD